MLSEEELTGLLEQACVCLHPCNHVIRSQGSPTDVGFVIMTGRVALVAEYENRKSLTMSLLTSGDLYGIIAPLERDIYPVTLRAQTTTSCICIPRESILAVLDDNPEVAHGITHYLFQRLEEAQRLCRMLAHDKLEVRVAAILFKLTTTLAQDSDEAIEGEIEITRQELAELCGASVEKVIGVVGSLKQAGYIDSPAKGRIRVLRRDKLIDLHL